MASPRWHPLARDLAVVVAVKLVLVAALWFAFFRGAVPVDPSTVPSVLDRPAAPAPHRE